MAEKELSPDERNNIRIRNLLANIERTFLPVNSTLGRYRIVEEIDRGGMAVVYKAIQLDLDRVVALKVMPANISINPGFVKRFLSEAHAIGQLNHPNIVKIIEVATEGNIYYLAMEYIPGQNLYYYLHYQKPKLVEVLEIVISLTEALANAHGQKIIHRDLKLNNVIMRDQKTPVLIDFGLAKAMENDEDERPGITRTGEVMGSPSYMAPERLLGGPVDHRSDICSLGIMLYEMLTFKNPYLDQRNLHQTTMNVMESNPIPPRRLVPWLPIEIEAITLKAMAKDPDKRYQTMGQFKIDLQNYLKGDPIAARPPSIISKVKRMVKRHWPSLVIGSIIVLFSALFAVTFYLQSKKEESHWQLIYNDDFVKPQQIEHWILSRGAIDTAQQFTLADGNLKGHSKEMIYALLNRHFNRDIRIECDIDANPQDLYNAGIFLSGNHPDSAYCFHINKNGGGITGMTLPGNSVILSDIPYGKAPLFQKNTLVIERINELITFSVNGTTVLKVYDNFPSLGKGHDKIGFFINNGSASFDNLNIYRRAIPEVPSPTMIADRFMERGDFEAALDEYSNLLVDLANLEIVKEVNIKMIDCLIRLGEFSEAEELLNNCSYLVNKEDPLKPRLLYLQSKIFACTRKSSSEDSIITLIAKKFPQSSINQAFINSAVMVFFDHIHSNQVISAKKDFFKFIDRYEKSGNRTDLLFEALIDFYDSKYQTDSVISLSDQIIKKAAKNESYVKLAKYRLACALLDKGKVNDAKQIFDQLITGNALPDRISDLLYFMAQISEYEFHSSETSKLYGRIYNESFQSIESGWMAAVNKTLFLNSDSSDTINKILNNIVTADHPFPGPRLVASYILGKVNDSIFVNQWKDIYPHNPLYLYYMARKAHISKNELKTVQHLNELKKRLNMKKWNYFRVIKILNNLDRW